MSHISKSALRLTAAVSTTHEVCLVTPGRSLWSVEDLRSLPMLLDDFDELLIQQDYRKRWTALKLGFTAKYFSGKKLVSNGDLCRGIPWPNELFEMSARCKLFLSASPRSEVLPRSEAG